MDKELEWMAYNGDPAPKGAGWRETVEYLAARYLYAANKIGAIEKEAASQEKRMVFALLRQADKNREFERKCWENSARRTVAAERAMTTYRKNRTLENADELVSRLDWLSDECARPATLTDYGATCPSCGKFFDQDHADRRPTYCEDCGCRLAWPPKEPPHGEA